MTIEPQLEAFDSIESESTLLADLISWIKEISYENKIEYEFHSQEILFKGFGGN